MSRTIEKTIFTLDELSDRAKERARDWFRSDPSDHYADFVIEDAATVADLIGIDLRQRPVTLASGKTKYVPAIYWTGFSSQGDGASFEGDYSHKRGAMKALKAHAPTDSELHRICAELQRVQSRYFYRLNASARHSRQNGNYYHSMTMSVECEIENSIYAMPDAAACEAVTKALRDFANWIYQRLEAEHNYQNSDEQVDTNILANGYEFDETGRIA